MIGAGPAGAAAAATAAQLGLSVLVLDESSAAGGRIHRAPSVAAEPSAADGSAADEGEALRRELGASGAELAFDHLVWHAALVPAAGRDEACFEVSAVGPQGLRQGRGRSLVIATGAVERFYPRPGWTLPGVVGLGAAAIMLKTWRVLPGRRVVVVGPDALALAVTKAILDAGGEVAAHVDPNPARAWAQALPALARRPALAARGLAWWTELARAGVPVHRGFDVRAIHGTGAVEGVTLGAVDGEWRPRAGGAGHTVAVDAVCMGYGLSPATEIHRMLGAAHRFDPALGGWTPVLEAGQRTSVSRLYGAGDSAAVLGAKVAAASGRIAALSAAFDLGRLDAATHDREAEKAHRSMSRELCFGAAMARLASPRSAAIGWIPDATIACRCEDVRAGELRAAIADGAREMNALKAATRCGMGPCGGRVCAEAAAALLECAGVLRERSGQWTARAPLSPLPLAALTGDFSYADIPFPPVVDT